MEMKWILHGLTTDHDNQDFTFSALENGMEKMSIVAWSVWHAVWKQLSTFTVWPEFVAQKISHSDNFANSRALSSCNSNWPTMPAKIFSLKPYTDKQLIKPEQSLSIGKSQTCSYLFLFNSSRTT